MVVYDTDGFWYKDVVNVVSDTSEGWEIWGDHHECAPIRKCRLLLKRMEDMNEEEETKYFELCKDILHLKDPNDEKENKLTTADSPESFMWLIQNRFDIFRLIERHLAFNVNKIPTHARNKIREVEVETEANVEEQTTTH